MSNRHVKFFYCVDVDNENYRTKTQTEISDLVNKLNSEGDKLVDIKTSLNTNGELFITVIYEYKYDFPVQILPREIKNK